MSSNGLPAPLRILYVEDNALVREVTCDLLANDQRQVVALATAEQALKEFKEQSFDLVITDISLPVMSGLDLVRNILNIRPEAPIIVASGYSLDFGPQSWGPNVRAILKPFEGSQIDALITDLCTRSARQRE